MITKKILIIVVIFLWPVIILGQSNKVDNYISLSLQGGYLKSLNNSKGQTTYGGFEIRPSIHYNLSKVVTLLFEYNYSRHKYDNSSEYTGYLNKHFLNLGLRVYPKSENSFYLKSAVSFPLSDDNDYQPIPGLNLGTGRDFRISDEVSFFTEAEIFFTCKGPFNNFIFTKCRIKN